MTICKFEVQVEITEVYKATVQVYAGSLADVEVRQHDLPRTTNWRAKRTWRTLSEPVELTPEVKFEKCIPSHESWELFSSQAGWRDAAEGLNNRLRKIFRRLQKVPAGRIREELAKARAEFYEIQGFKKYSKYGATDSEPRGTADAAFERFANTVLGVDASFEFGDMVR